MSSTDINSGALDPRNTVQRSVETVKDELNEVRQTAEQMRERLKDAGSQAVSGVADKVRLEAGAKVDEATGSFRRIANELDRAAESCSTNEEWASKLFTAGASSLKSVSDYLSGTQLEDLVREGEAFARRNPVAFIGGTIAAGFLLSRVGKTAASRANDLARNESGERDRSDFQAFNQYPAE